MGKMLKIPAKTEKVTPDELKQYNSFASAVAFTQKAAEEASMVHEEAKTTLAYHVMQLRHKYKLKVGDQIDDKSGQITRS